MESAAQASLPRDPGCDVLQGHHLSRPLAPEAFLGFALAHGAAADQVTGLHAG